MKILFTGKNGFVGKNILPILNDKFEIVAPTRTQLDLRDLDKVLTFVKEGKFDVICHFANPNPVKNDEDQLDRIFEDSLRIFMNLHAASKYCDKMLYLGSGAEYDKRNELKLVSEEKIGESIPIDSYGFSKYIMNELSSKSNNMYNLRIFGCFGPYDHDSKFIKHSINCSMDDQLITIRQNCYFDYLFVDDLAKIIEWFIENDPKHMNYNVCTGKRISLEEIAIEVARQMNNLNGVKVMSEGFNREYTADNKRLLNELGPFKFTSLEDGIKKQIEWQRRE